MFHVLVDVSHKERFFVCSIDGTDGVIVGRGYSAVGIIIGFLALIVDIVELHRHEV